MQNEAKKQVQEYTRTPLGYDGSKPTSRRLCDLLSNVMVKLAPLYKSQPNLMLEVWPKVIGEKFAQFTKAERFENATLFVSVKNSTLLSLLNNPVDKKRLVESLRKSAPGAQVNTIVFRIG